MATVSPPIYGTCFNVSIPSPAPTTGQATTPICINGILQTTGILSVSSALPVTIASTVPVSISSAVPVTGAFPTPIPFPTLGVNVLNTPSVNQGTSPWVVTTPPPFNGVVSGTVTANAGTGFPTPLAVQPVSGTITVNTPPPTTTVTVTQGTGTNLHVVNDASSAVIGHVISDSGSVTNSTLQTGANVIGSISNTSFIATQSTGTNLHAVLDANSAVRIGITTTDQTTPGTTDLIHAKVCDTSTPTTCVGVTANGITTRDHAPVSSTILTSSSATTCTNVLASAANGVEIINSGPATTVFLQIYNDAGSTCAAGTLLYGDGSTLVIGAGQIIKIDFSMAGIAYKLSGSLTANLSLTGL